MHNVVSRISAAVIEALLPVIKEIKNDLNSLRETVDQLNETINQQDEVIRTLNETVATLAGEAQEHRIETETKLDDLQTSLLSVIVSLSEEMKEHINQTVTNLQSDSIDPINATLISVTTDLSCVKTDLSRVSDAVSDLSGDLEEHSSQTSREIQSSLQQLSVKTNTLQSTLDSVDTRMIQGFALLDCATSSELNSHDTKLDSLSTQIAGDFNDVRTQLSSVSNEICDKIEDHEKHMESELDDLERNLSNQTNQGFTSLDCATGSELTLHDTKLDSLGTQITSDFNGARTDLNSISDRMKNHDRKTDNKLLDIVCLHQDPNGACYTCGGTGGWRRAVYLDMTDLNTNCPPGWNETDYSNRTCGRATDGLYTCDSAYFPISGGEYSQVCGSVVAYQWGWGSGFAEACYNSPADVNSQYFGGMAVMHGNPRQHIWTFVTGAAENYSYGNYGICPCDVNFAGTLSRCIPPFVGSDYFCESGYLYGYGLHTDDPLWDGNGCHSTSTCCSLNNPPYFTKTLNMITTDDLELRLCNQSDGENTAVELVELYVK